MSAGEDAYARAQQTRWMRPDAHRWIRPDAARFLKPGTDPASVYPALERKYSPNQPRVPAGNPDGGQWTDGDGSSGASVPNSTQPMGNIDFGDLPSFSDLFALFQITPSEIDNSDYTQLAGDVPEGDGPGIGHNEGPPLEPPEIPAETPKRGGDWMQFARSAAGWVKLVGRYSPYADAFFGAVKQIDETNEIINTIKSANDPPRTLEELQTRVGLPADGGYHDHHIVNQHAGNRSLFGDRAVDSRSNQARIPVLKHIEISRWYATRNEGFGGLTPRDYLRDKSWEEQTKIGLYIMKREGVLK